MCMYKHLLTNRLHGKGAELAVVAEITVLQVQNILSTVTLSQPQPPYGGLT